MASQQCWGHLWQCRAAVAHASNVGATCGNVVRQWPMPRPLPNPPKPVRHRPPKGYLHDDTNPA